MCGTKWNPKSRRVYIDRYIYHSACGMFLRAEPFCVVLISASLLDLSILFLSDIAHEKDGMLRLILHIKLSRYAPFSAPPYKNLCYMSSSYILFHQKYPLGNILTSAKVKIPIELDNKLSSCLWPVIVIVPLSKLQVLFDLCTM